MSSYKVELQSPAPVMALVTLAQVAIALLALVTAAVAAVAVALVAVGRPPPLMPENMCAPVTPPCPPNDGVYIRLLTLLQKPEALHQAAAVQSG